MDTERVTVHPEVVTERSPLATARKTYLNRPYALAHPHHPPERHALFNTQSSGSNVKWKRIIRPEFGLESEVMKMGLLAIMATAQLSAPTPFQVRTDISQVPSAAAYAELSKALCEEWYPKINEILYGTDHPLPYGEIVVMFDPEKIYGRYGQGHAVGVAVGNTIHISSGWLGQRPSPKDFCGLMIHELAHVNQEYGNFHPRHDHLLALVRPVRIKLSQEYRMGWLAEGIADYVRYKYYEKELRLGLDEKTYLRLRNRGYREGYGFAALFLLWLEERKDEHIVRKLNVVLEQRRYSASVFKQNCGAPLDSLWQEFLDQTWFGSGK